MKQVTLNKISFVLDLITKALNDVAEQLNHKSFEEWEKENVRTKPTE